MRELIEHAPLDYAVFMVTAVAGLLLLAAYVYFKQDQSQTSQLSFPGMNATDADLGNLGDVKKAGSFHDFLVALHKTHGPLASFWWGKKLAVSAASPALWKDLLPLFNRPVEQFMLFEPLIGKDSIQYANFSKGKKHRTLIDRCFGHSEILSFVHQFNKVASELCSSWRQHAHREEHVPLKQHMIACALKSILKTSFGESFSSKEIMQFEKGYNICWTEMESQLNGSSGEDDPERKTKFEESRSFLRSVCKRVLSDRRSSGCSTGKALLIDRMMEDDDVYPTDDAIVDNIMTNIIGGFHTTGNLLTWVLYYLASNSDCEERLLQEIHAFAADDDVTMEQISSMPYLRSVIDESMRCSVLAPWAARFSEYESVVGGHTISKETPIILALGVVLQDDSIWKEPNRFDPDRFSGKDGKAKRHPLAFSPFGFAGKRKCPGFRFAYAESSVMVIRLLRTFKIKLVEGQTVEKVYGLVTHPKEEIWITLEERCPSGDC